MAEENVQENEDVKTDVETDGAENTEATEAPKADASGVQNTSDLTGDDEE